MKKRNIWARVGVAVGIGVGAAGGGYVAKKGVDAYERSKEAEFRANRPGVIALLPPLPPEPAEALPPAEAAALAQKRGDAAYIHDAVREKGYPPVSVKAQVEYVVGGGIVGAAATGLAAMAAVNKLGRKENGTWVENEGQRGAAPDAEPSVG